MSHSSLQGQCTKGTMCALPAPSGTDREDPERKGSYGRRGRTGRDKVKKKGKTEFMVQALQWHEQNYPGAYVSENWLPSTQRGSTKQGGNQVDKKRTRVSQP